LQEVANNVKHANIETKDRIASFSSLTRIRVETLLQYGSQPTGLAAVAAFIARSAENRRQVLF